MGTLPFHIGITDHVLMVWTGSPGLEDIQAAIRQTLEHRDFRNGMPVVCEGLPAGYNPPSGEVRAIAQELASCREQLGPIALVVRSTLHFGLGNMLHTYCRMEGIRLAVFYDREKGLDWAWREAEVPRARYFKAGA